MDSLIAAREGLAFVEQYPYVHGLQARDHLDGVMIAEHGVSRLLYLCSQFFNALQSRLKRSVSLSPVIAGQHADIKTQGADDLEQMPHGPLAQVHMQIADVKDSELVKCRRQILEVRDRCV